jgi:hypothetical protein
MNDHNGKSENIDDEQVYVIEISEFYQPENRKHKSGA